MPPKLVLKKRPRGVTIIEGFPGIGLVGTITTEYLTEHLKTEKIGGVLIDDVPAIGFRNHRLLVGGVGEQLPVARLQVGIRRRLQRRLDAAAEHQT